MRLRTAIAAVLLAVTTVLAGAATATADDDPGSSLDNSDFGIGDLMRL
ncbi:hypothetical protein ACIQU6_39595 [Streptomyces sp. NPDC090442]